MKFFLWKGNVVRVIRVRVIEVLLFPFKLCLCCFLTVSCPINVILASFDVSVSYLVLRPSKTERKTRENSALLRCPNKSSKNCVHSTPVVPNLRLSIDRRFPIQPWPQEDEKCSKKKLNSVLPELALLRTGSPSSIEYTNIRKTSAFQASYFNRIVKLWNYVCKLAPPTSFSSPTAFQLFVHKLMSTHLSRVYEINYPCTWTLVPTCPCHS